MKARREGYNILFEFGEVTKTTKRVSTTQYDELFDYFKKLIDKERNKSKIDKEELKKLVLNRGLTLTDLIDVVIELNAIIGVGLITLGDNLSDYCKSKIT